MTPNEVTPNRRNRLEFVRPGTKRGDVVELRLLEPEVVSVLTDNPAGGSPRTTWRRLPGQRATVVLSGWPFVFTVRVLEESGSAPRVVDLRVHSPVDCGDVPILNADLKSVPLAKIAAAVGSGLLTSGEKVFDPERWTAPEQHTDAASARQAQPRGRGRPRKLTDEFLVRAADFARNAHERDEPIVPFVTAAMTAPGDVPPAPNTVRWWLAEARKRGVLTAGELRKRNAP